MIKKTLSIAFLFALSGCVIINPSDLPPSLNGKTLDNYGMVFGSIGEDRENGGFTLQGLYYRKIGDKESGKFIFGNNDSNNTPKDFINGKITGSVFLAKLPPGEYEVYNLYFYENLGLSYNTFSARGDFSVKFSVKEGKAAYLGEFLSHRTTGKNILGMRITEGGYFVVSNKIERDASILTSKGETLPSEKEVITPLFLKINHPLLRSRTTQSEP